MALRALLVDDEALARARMRSLLDGFQLLEQLGVQHGGYFLTTPIL